MAEQWYYRMFGQDFGPVGFDELKQLVELGSISSSDEIRPSNSSNWVTADSVSELEIRKEVSATPLQPTADPSTGPAGADEWMCKMHGQELGPLSFNELLEFAKNGQIDANDEVMLGTSGKWRRVGSIGRLVAVLPYHEPVVAEPKAAETAAARQAPSSPSIATPVEVTAPKPVSEPAVNTVLIQAQTAMAAADQTAKMLVSWALAPNVDPAWWGWIGGAEYGPVGFVQVYDWALSGRLKSSDFVKNGMYSQYGPAANVPGLFSAVAIVTQARTALSVAQASAIPATPAVAPPAPAVPIAAAPVPAVAAAPAAVSIPKPIEAARPVTQPTPQATVQKPEAIAPKPEPDVPSKPASIAPYPAPSSPSMSARSSFAASAPRPMPSPSRAPVRSSDGSPLAPVIAILMNPIALGAVAVVLLGVGFMYLPKGYGKDPERCKALQKLLDDVRAAREGSKNFEPMKAEAKKLIAEYVEPLSKEANNDNPAKQALLWATRDELPRMMGGDLTKESAPERNMAARLKDAARIMGIK